MCTAITYHGKCHYFGRNLDLEYSYRESVTVTPRNYPFHFRCAGPLNSHFAIIGVAMIDHNYPLYYDATNEHGLSIAGLNFPGNAVYLPKSEEFDNITPFEFIPWILGQCVNVSQAKDKIKGMNLVDIAYSSDYPLTPLHWIIADKEQAITVEPTEHGLKIYENHIGVLTNNPPFDYHIQNLSNYLNLTAEEPKSRFSQHYTLLPYSRGMGAMGLPGDLSSSSRFVRAAFTKLNSVTKETEEESISQFFHILGSVAQQEGCVKVGEHYEKTVYSSCCNVDEGIYYYTTYGNSQITGVSMHNTNLNDQKLTAYPLINFQQIRMENPKPNSPLKVFVQKLLRF